MILGVSLHLAFTSGQIAVEPMLNKEAKSPRPLAPFGLTGFGYLGYKQQSFCVI